MREKEHEGITEWMRVTERVSEWERESEWMSDYNREEDKMWVSERGRICDGMKERVTELEREEYCN